MHGEMSVSRTDKRVHTNENRSWRDPCRTERQAVGISGTCAACVNVKMTRRKAGHGSRGLAIPAVQAILGELAGLRWAPVLQRWNPSQGFA